MRKILLLCLLSTLFLACENASNYITVHLKDVNLSTDINVGEDESVITGEPTLIKLALGNTITQPTDYYLTFIPQVGQGVLTHDGNELKANSEYKYTSTKSNDVVELY